MENNNESTGEESTPANTTEGVQQEAVTDMDRADAINDRTQRENDRREALIGREEAMAIRKQVGGVAEGGQPSEKKEETDLEYKDRVMAGKL